MTDGAGRFAPSPSGELHLGNLRTALLAWLFARSTDRAFLMRVEDLDRVRPGAEATQLSDLAAIRLDWDGDVVHQSQRIPLYDRVIQDLTDAGRTYECFCTRKEILNAASAPHAPQGAYPGTCRDLTPNQRAERRSTGRDPAIRLRADVVEFTVTDTLLGDYTGVVDDLVLRRSDGIPAYNLAVVVDDGAQGIDQVVRGDDLLSSSPRQAYLATLLNIPIPHYAHVPLALNTDGKRLAKRDGAVTLADQLAQGNTAVDVLKMLAQSLCLQGDSPHDLLASFDPTALPREPWIVRG
ncbi:tRNA glutamyl-Q(34) synthetase GluQRS [Antrihabitans cavernicola]|uniref:Glutamyl-Q tRNA(Asp) synthetase n=1 Tax=Antrihabitans cavernicola TaxID=2495913 RepID=A0A5A7SJD4_9NOCA|nr:tRNA glutamyl-Q(34) synthetase GluQRS [Spelaeibacter cavernicola]KAA0024545.1 tRNA glutamyl-Q(34) synthetase GluQRS [Spelaeibacter cavernicola]